MTTPVSPNSNNPWFAVSMGLVGVIVGYMLGSGSAAMPSPSAPTPPAIPSAPSDAPEAPPAGDVKPVDTKVDHIRGNPKAKVSVIEYSDIECPFCARNHPTMKQILETYGDDVNWVYRHYPLPFHANAQKAAEATECAAELGGNDTFWEMIDMMMEKGVADAAQFAVYAKSVGLNEAKFTECLNSGKHAQRVTDDMTGGSAAGVNGTPGNIVLNNETEDSRNISGAQPFSAFQTVIDEMLK
jgi:protein-disulfide isomerase